MSCPNLSIKKAFAPTKKLRYKFINCKCMQEYSNQYVLHSFIFVHTLMQISPLFSFALKMHFSQRNAIHIDLNILA